LAPEKDVRATLLQVVKKIRIDEIRKSPSHYSEPLLDSFSAILATSTLYFLYNVYISSNPAGFRFK